MKIGDSKGNQSLYFFTDGETNFTFKFTIDKQKELATLLNSMCRKFDFKANYECTRQIGVGSYAKVFECKGKIEDSPRVAVKVYDKEKFFQKESHKLSLAKEIKCLMELDHPNIQAMYEVFEGQRHIYLVCELMEGGDLNKRIKDCGVFDEEKGAYLIMQILNALQYIHKLGYIHRDLKMGNIMFKDEAGLILKIIDFGFVERVNTPFTVQRCGTGGYLAPEIFTDDTYNEKVDIFSVGIILYTLFSYSNVRLRGKNPFRLASTNETLKKNRECDLSFLESADLDSDSWLYFT